MNCSWRESTDAKGRRVDCTRKGCKKYARPPAGQPLSKVRCECHGWPFGWELGHWFAVFLAAAGITKGRWNWLRRKLGYDKPCGCDQRETEINTWGAKFAAWLASWRT